jgi:hypothetical protein
MMSDICDVLETCRDACDEYDLARIHLLTIKEKRDAAIRKAHDKGYGYRKLARAVGVTSARIHQVVKEAS